MSQTQVSVGADADWLEVIHSQWLLGDWESLSKLTPNALEGHPKRARLVLYAATGYVQIGRIEQAREFIKLARTWGCSKSLISRALISGVYNTLARAEAASDNEARALAHFQKAMSAVYPHSATHLLAQARAETQLTELELASGTTTSTLPGSSRSRDRHIALQIASLASDCIASTDLHASVRQTIEQYKLTKGDLFAFLIELSDQIARGSDKLTALHYLQQARRSSTMLTRSDLAALVKRLVALGQYTEAEALVTQAALDGTGTLALNDKEKAAIQKASLQRHDTIAKKSEHGHDLLLSALNKYLPSFPKESVSRKPLLIEIGTTREEVPGQGSTRKLAQYCQKNGVDFVTVDMDPHNSNGARQVFTEIGAEYFQAISMKGEDYLREYADTFDFIFLDAYDFDHGKHSELRQSRYERFLGARIDETECHKMHLDCAQSILRKLSPYGLVCIDDTWLEDGRWTAKGTLAMPYLLANGFELVEARNRAALLRRQVAQTSESKA